MKKTLLALVIMLTPLLSTTDAIADTYLLCSVGSSNYYAVVTDNKFQLTNKLGVDTVYKLRKSNGVYNTYMDKVNTLTINRYTGELVRGSQYGICGKSKEKLF